jgi:hypothetical protein
MASISRWGDGLASPTHAAPANQSPQLGGEKKGGGLERKKTRVNLWGGAASAGAGTSSSTGKPRASFVEAGDNGAATAEILTCVDTILRGGFVHFDKLKNWYPLRSKLLVFVFSTFTDTHRERNILLESILPDIRAEGNKCGIDVTFVDMRWGVVDENTIDHETWDECARELDRCNSESAGLFFMSLQADKYGYVSLPRTLDRTALESKMEDMSVDERQLAEKWYRLDTNSIPPRYVLRTLRSLKDTDYWEIALPALRRELSGVEFDGCRFPQLTIGQSVSHWEALTALRKMNDNQGSHITRFIWNHRHFADTVTIDFDPSKHYIYN